MRVVTFVVLAALSASAAAQTPPSEQSGTADPLASLYVCADNADQAARLSCYDSAVATLRAGAASGQIVALDRGHVQEIERDSFGFTLPSLTRLLPSIGSGEVEAVELHLARIAPRPNERSAFVMSDGQVWTQVETKRVRNLRAGDTVRVRRAALGSYILISPHGTAYRVRREN